MAGVKRRHEDSSFAVPLSQEHKGVTNLYINNHVAEDDRVHSPNNIMDTNTVFLPPTRESKRTLSFASKREEYDAESDPDAEKRVTIWNWREQRKLSGNSAPFKKNLKDYIRKHPDWEEYVGQDKDAITGKKLSPKKMKPPAPQDPSHPWYNMQKSAPLPSSPSAPPMPAATSHTSSYGTRSTQTRLQESDGLRLSTRAAPVAKAKPPLQVLETVYVNPELSQPMQIVLEPPAVIARRRSVEMAARLQALASEVPNQNDASDKKEEAQLEDQKAERDAAWKAASAEVARLRAEQEAAERKLAEETLSQRRCAHAQVQHGVAIAAMARIEAFRNKRRMIAA